MKTDFSALSESIAYAGTWEYESAQFYLQATEVESPGGDDDEEDETEEDDKSKGNGNDDPPLDPETVHSPLTPQPGGQPK